MITTLVAERRWVPLAIIGAALAMHVGMWIRLVPCPGMNMVDCLAAAAGVVGVGSLVAVIVRSVRLARTTTRAVTSLGHAPLPSAGRATARRAGLRRVACVPGDGPAAFTAGLWRPHVYVTNGAVETLPPDELDAVLAHEAAHVRRRDPLRRLVNRAAADALFYLPLANWWADRQIERSELTADRAAIDHAGRPAVAGALLAAGAAQPPGTIGFDGAIDARIAQLTGDQIPPHRPTRKRVAVSALGLLLITSLTMCLGQALIGIVTA